MAKIHKFTFKEKINLVVFIFWAFPFFSGSKPAKNGRVFRGNLFLGEKPIKRISASTPNANFNNIKNLTV